MDALENLAGDSLSQQITRDYRIIRLLGKGGMGEVYLAEQLRVGRRLVALKVLNRACCENPDLMRRFENEAASAGRIHHRNVVTVYESRVTDDGQLTIVDGAEKVARLPVDLLTDGAVLGGRARARKRHEAGIGHPGPS